MKFEQTELHTARWLSANDPATLKTFVDGNQSSIAYDHDNDPVFLARNAWHLDDAVEKNPGVQFGAVK